MSERPDLRVVGVKPAGDAAAAGRATAPGLALDDALGRDDWLALGKEISRRRDISGWHLGDWARHGERHWGDLTVAAAEIGIARKTLYHCAGVARRFEDPARRRVGVSFSSHAEVAALDAETAERILDDAAAGGWPRERVREAVREARCGGCKPTDPARARDAADRMRDRIGAEQRVAAGAAGRMTKVAVEASRSSEIRAMHRSAQYGLARDIRREFGKAGAALRARHADAAAALAPIEGPEAGGAGADERAVAALMDGIDPVLRAVMGRIAQASRDAAGMPPAERRALAARLEAAIDARIEGAQTVLQDEIQPALEHLAGEP